MIDNFLTFCLFGLAAFRLTRLVVFDRITEFIRKPFHEEIEELDEHGNAVSYIKIKGSGIRGWIGELLSCYWCSGVWCSGALLAMWAFFPVIAEPILLLLAVAGLAGIIEAIVSKLLE